MTLTKQDRPLPCINCITFAICRQVGGMTNGVSTLAMKCSIIDEYLTENGEWNIEYMYRTWVYFDRGE